MTKEIGFRGPSTLGLLGILFVGLKLTGYIDWSWWWVTAPFWGGFVISVVFLILWAVVYSTSKCKRFR